MNNNIIPVIVAAIGALALVSCATGPTMQPAADLEAVERQAPVSGTPNVGQHHAGRNAVRYSNSYTPYWF